MSSESPKWIALGLSIFAITISGLSWWESHQNRVISEEVNRPILAMSEIVAFNFFSKEKERSKGWFSIKLRNTGKSTAVVNYVTIASIKFFSGEGCKIEPEDRGSQPEKPEILASAQQDVTADFTITSGCGGAPSVVLDTSILVVYTTPSSGKSYVQAFDAHLP